MTILVSSKITILLIQIFLQLFKYLNLQLNKQVDEFVASFYIELFCFDYLIVECCYEIQNHVLSINFSCDFVFVFILMLILIFVQLFMMRHKGPMILHLIQIDEIVNCPHYSSKELMCNFISNILTRTMLCYLDSHAIHQSLLFYT